MNGILMEKETLFCRFNLHNILYVLLHYYYIKKGRHIVCIGERIWGLKKAIEEKRRKLNALMDQDVPEITDEILDVSYKLDILIKDYYYRQIEGKE